ncbi:hypothetical protein HD554DRAFT_2175409 [Boletus coccyginus]|nr:hypothetical protein HD554DRAFT_2175409 [Boletus coccyginus]
MSSAASLNVDLAPSLGAYFIGLLFGAVFLGITWAQTISYYREYPDDRVFLKLLVGSFLAMYTFYNDTLFRPTRVFDTLSFIFFAHAAYTYMIIGFGNFAIASSLVWSLGSEPIWTDLVGIIVHLFLAYRVQLLDPRWRIFSVVIAAILQALVSLAAFGDHLVFCGPLT